MQVGNQCACCAPLHLLLTKRTQQTNKQQEDDASLPVPVSTIVMVVDEGDGGGKVEAGTGSSATKRDYGFGLTTPVAKMRFRCKSERERQQWLAAIAAEQVALLVVGRADVCLLSVPAQRAAVQEETRTPRSPEDGAAKVRATAGARWVALTAWPDAVDRAAVQQRQQQRRVVAADQPLRPGAVVVAGSGGVCLLWTWRAVFTLSQSEDASSGNEGPEHRGVR